MHTKKPIHIFLIEDNAGDVRLVQEFLKESPVKTVLNFVHSSEDAIEYLSKRGAHKNAARPDIILLDLNLPGQDGRSLLKMIKTDSSLKLIPVIVLTTSSSEDDVTHSYELQANAYLEKPVKFDEFCRTMKAFEDLWFVAAKLPGR